MSPLLYATSRTVPASSHTSRHVMMSACRTSPLQFMRRRAPRLGTNMLGTGYGRPGGPGPSGGAAMQPGRPQRPERQSSPAQSQLTAQVTTPLRPPLRSLALCQPRRRCTAPYTEVCGWAIKYIVNVRAPLSLMGPKTGYGSPRDEILATPLVPYELNPEESACVQVKAVQGFILYRIVFNVSVDWQAVFCITYPQCCVASSIS